MILTAKAKKAAENYGVLPWWACCKIGKANLQLPWSAKAVLAVVMGRLMSLKAAALQNDDGTLELDGVRWENFSRAERRSAF